MKFKTLITAVFVLSVFTFAQAQLAMGKWRTHLAFNSVLQIAQSENKIFAVSGGSLFSVDKEEKNIELYSKMTGLSDNNVVGIEYDAVNKQLLIIYSNGNIDILVNGKLTSFAKCHRMEAETSNGNDYLSILEFIEDADFPLIYSIEYSPAHMTEFAPKWKLIAIDN